MNLSDIPMNSLSDTDKLAKAIKEGKSYHIFNKEDGSYRCSLYFQRTADDVVKTIGADIVEMKYLTNVKKG